MKKYITFLTLFLSLLCFSGSSFALGPSSTSTSSSAQSGSGPNWAQVETKTKNTIKIITTVVIYGLILIGICFVAGALFAFKKASDQPNQEHGKKGVVSLAIGIGLLSISGIVALFTDGLGLGGSGSNSNFDPFAYEPTHHIEITV